MYIERDIVRTAHATIDVEVTSYESDFTTIKIELPNLVSGSQVTYYNLFVLSIIFALTPLMQSMGTRCKWVFYTEIEILNSV